MWRGDGLIKRWLWQQCVVLHAATMGLNVMPRHGSCPPSPFIIFCNRTGCTEGTHCTILCYAQPWVELSNGQQMADNIVCPCSQCCALMLCVAFTMLFSPAFHVPLVSCACCPH